MMQGSGRRGGRRSGWWLLCLVPVREVRLDEMPKGGGEIQRLEDRVGVAVAWTWVRGIRPSGFSGDRHTRYCRTVDRAHEPKRARVSRSSPLKPRPAQSLQRAERVTHVF